MKLSVRVSTRAAFALCILISIPRITPLGMVPCECGGGGEQNISSRCRWDNIFGAGLWVDRRGAPLTYPKASSQPLAYDYQVPL